MSVKIKLGHRRPARPARPAAPCKPATGCTCPIHHAITAAERDRVLDEIVHARTVGESDLVANLLERLNTRNCRFVRGAW